MSGASAVLDRLAVLLEAGVGPAAAWGHLAAVSDDRGFDLVADGLAAGHPGAALIVEALGSESGGASASEWRQIAAAWAVAEETGAPLAASLRAAADSSRATAQARRDAETALSGPVATSRVVLALPAVGLLLGLALGADTLGVLLGRPLGWTCLAAAALLVAAGRLWNRRLVRRATPSQAVPGLELELLAAALGGGGSWAVARNRVDGAIARYCPGDHEPTPTSDLEVIIALSEAAGVPAAGLLRSSAAERRRDARATAAIAAERLGVMLMLPLGACILPAFLLVGVVPLFVALLSSTAAVG